MSMRENIIKLLGDDVCEHDSCENCEYKENRDDCIYFLKKRMADYLVANDVVRVVRCKDCITHDLCIVEDHLVFSGWKNPFCCAGKRKDGYENEQARNRRNAVYDGSEPKSGYAVSEESASEK